MKWKILMQKNFEKIYIMSGEIGLYEKYGFVKLGDYKTVYGSVDQLFVQTISDR